MDLTFKKGSVPLVDLGQIPEGHMVFGETEDGKLVIAQTDNEIQADYRNDITQYDAADEATPLLLIGIARAEQANALAVMFKDMADRMKGAGLNDPDTKPE